jgi:hypothetical protein
LGQSGKEKNGGSGLSWRRNNLPDLDGRFALFGHFLDRLSDDFWVSDHRIERHEPTLAKSSCEAKLDRALDHQIHAAPAEIFQESFDLHVVEVAE